MVTPNVVAVALVTTSTTLTLVSIADSPPTACIMLVITAPAFARKLRPFMPGTASVRYTPVPGGGRYRGLSLGSTASAVPTLMASRPSKPPKQPPNQQNKHRFFFFFSSSSCPFFGPTGSPSTSS